MSNRYKTLLVCIAFFSTLLPVFAQDNRIILDNNFGTSSTLWEIQGERTLVMNGFDLVPTPLQLPIVIENINISLFSANPNEIVDIIVYEDPNGGSPVDARVVSTFQTNLPNDSGVFTYNFPNPVIVDSAIVWIGLYMPVGTRFRADRQGTSLLTYWAWTPGGEFNLRDLSSAQIFGPSDGSGPVNINLEGVARIRAEARSADTSMTESFYAQLDFVEPDPYSYLINYEGCPTLFKDEGDVDVTYNQRISSSCRELESWNAPRSPSGYTRRTNARGTVYDLTFFNDDGEVLTGEIPEPVTHCVTPADTELESSEFGLAYGSPRRWEFIPSEAFGNLLCAEISRGGSISYFTPD